MESAAPRDPLTISRESFRNQSDATGASLNAGAIRRPNGKKRKVGRMRGNDILVTFDPRLF